MPSNRDSYQGRPLEQLTANREQSQDRLNEIRDRVAPGFMLGRDDYNDTFRFRTPTNPTFAADTDITASVDTPADGYTYGYSGGRSRTRPLSPNSVASNTTLEGNEEMITARPSTRSTFADYMMQTMGLRDEPRGVSDAMEIEMKKERFRKFMEPSHKSKRFEYRESVCFPALLSEVNAEEPVLMTDINRVREKQKQEYNYETGDFEPIDFWEEADESEKTA